MTLQLVSLSGGPSILLDKPILLVGRHQECDIQIDSRKISRRHCCLAQVQDYLVVRDLGSTNGVRVNGIRVIEGKLADNDELTIGNLRFRLTREDGSVDPSVHAKARNKAPVAKKAPRSEDRLLEECSAPIPLVDPANPD
jgi:pSer/pThr/pTyr-binding forkhead associated (FHA) protein